MALGSTAPASAQRSGQQAEQIEDLDFQEKLGEVIPTDLVFRDENGDEVPLAQYFDGETPVVLNLVYHDCPMLCNVMLDGFTETLKGLSWTPGDQYEILTVSFNERETPEQARRQKARYLEELGREEVAAGWHFLTGDKEEIDALTDAVGFEFKWIEERQEFAHPTTTIFLSGEGLISRYLFGLSPSPSDTRKALVEASGGQVGNLVDQAILYCFQYDPSENAYVANAFNIMRLAGGITVVFLGIGLFFLWRRERRNQDRAWSGDPDTGDEPAFAS